MCECVQLVCAASIEKLELISPAVGINLLACLRRTLKQTPELPTWQKFVVIGVRVQFKCKCAVFIHVSQISLIYWASWGA